MKKFISILLVMCICTSIGMCSITASAADTPEITTPSADRVTDSTVTYYFDGYAFGETDALVDSTSIADNTANLTIDKFKDHGDKSAKWGLFGISGGYGFKALVRTQSIQWQPVVPETTAVFNPDSGETIYSIAFELDVQDTGTYIPKLNYYGNVNSPKVEIYVIPKSENAQAWTNYDEFVKKLSTSDRLCELDLYHAEAGWYDSADIPVVNMTEGSNLFIMVLNGMNADAETGAGAKTGQHTEYLRPRSLSLTPVNRTLEYDFSLSAFEYEKMPRNNANTPLWIGVRASSTVLPENVVDTKNFQGIMNPSFFDRNAQLNAVAAKESDAVKVVLDEKVAYKDGYFQITEPYYAMKERENDTYWSLECYSRGSTSHRAWGAAFYSFFDSNKFSKESTAQPSSDRPLTAFRINISSAGEYKLGISTSSKNNANNYVTSGIVSDVYVMKAPSTTVKAADIDTYHNSDSFEYLGTHDSGVDSTEYITVGDNTSFTVSEPGEYILLFDTDENTFADTGITNPEGNYHLVISGIKLTPVITPDAEKEEIVNEDGNTLSATGEAETSVTVKQGKAVLDGEAEPSFTDVDVINGYATVTATPTDDAGNEFLYWAKGLTTGIGKKIFIPDNDNELSCTFKPATGVNYIIAVYAPKNVAETKYYNANGQLLTDANESTVPTMSGYTFKEWVDCGNGMMVADYTENEITYTVTVKHQDGEAEAVEKEELSGKKYGDSVTVTAPSRFGGSGYNVFNYWKKDGEIVSFNKSYTFNVWENCEVTAVYKAYAPVATTLKKIIIDNMDENNLMAEFIGFGDVAEKGIVFGENATLTENEGKATMTSNKTQFTVNNDINGTPPARGYVIDKEGNVYYGN